MRKTQHTVHNEDDTDNFQRLEREIAETMSSTKAYNPEDYAPPAVREANHRSPLPQLPELEDEYVSPVKATEEKAKAAYQAGEISEQAIAVQFEAVAKEVEAMGMVLKETAKQAEKMMTDVTSALEYVGEIALKYRSGGKVLFSRLEKVSAMAESVKATCESLKKQITEDG